MFQATPYSGNRELDYGLWDDARGELLVGPFQGLPACTRIGLGNGVCGTAVKTTPGGDRRPPGLPVAW